jgi:GAG-pre-integrase domain
VKDQATHKILLHGTLLNGLYQLDIQLNNNHVLLTNQASSLWHSRLAHCSSAVVIALHNQNKIVSTSSKVSLCTDCCKAKAHKLPFSTSLTVTTAPLQLVHTDLWGPSPITSNSDNRYYIMFTDDFSRFSWIYCITCKSEVSRVFA